MEKLTRTKKYAQLREELENDRETAIETPDLNQYANKLNQFDDTQFHHFEDKPSVAATREKVLSTSLLQDEEIVDVPAQDFMKEVVSEVKDYNRKQGLIQDDDTQANILKELRSSNSVRPFGNVSHISEMANQILKDEPTPLKEVIEETSLEPMDIPFVQDMDINNTISIEIQKLLQSSSEIEEDSFEERILNDLQINKASEVVEETSTKEILEHNMFTEFHLNQSNDTNKIEDTKEEVADFKLNEPVIEEKMPENPSKVDEIKETPTIDDEDNYDEPSSGNFLNVILVILILVMIVVLAIILYLILLNKGII